MPLIEAPASDSSREYTPLAYLQAYDAVLDDDYAFAAYKELYRDSGEWLVRIVSRHTAGGSFEPEAMRKQARSAGAQGQPYFVWGYSFSPSEGDPRCIEFRVYQKDGVPSEVEIFVQLRNADGTASAPVITRFAWPA
ncbi:MAG: hypothetical protein KDC87_19430 [Planctomycetes bacterium]|nr:hypothetical protein [Planctomycetota bacterium]MCB9868624.1 hypothetical protein [Planctomycetota bacterium]MCB9889212.1 hypothetical protein [Planctomycetota bacterium]